MKKIFKTILLLIFLAIFIFSTYKVVNYLWEAYQNKKMNSKLIDEAITTIDSQEGEEQEEIIDETIPPISVDFNILKQKNNDIVGWIYSKDTPINNPILQSKDNSYYLRRLMTKEYNTAGSLFMDFRNNSNMQDNNTIIYGHNMKNGTMFGTIQKYRNQEYYDKHKNMYYFTPEKNYIVRIFTGFTTSIDLELYNLPTLNQTKIDNLVKKSNFKTDITVTENDKLLTLSTCAYDYESARYVVIGLLEEI